MINAGDKISRSELERSVRIFRNAEVFLETVETNPRFARGPLSQDIESLLLIRPSIDHAEFPMVVGLTAYRSEHFIQELFRGIVDGNKQTDFRSGLQL